jgi:hypothetical protein
LPISNLITTISSHTTENIFNQLIKPIDSLITSISGIPPISTTPTTPTKPSSGSTATSAPIGTTDDIFTKLMAPINELIKKISPDMINVSDIQSEFEKIKKEIVLENPKKNEIEKKIEEMIDTDKQLNTVFKELSSDDLGLESSLTSSILTLGGNLLKLQKSMIQDTFNELKKNAKNKKLQERIANIFTKLSDKTDKMNEILINKQKQYKMNIV